MKYPNIYALFRERVAEYAGRDAFFVRREGEWRGSSWETFGADAHALASVLLASGLGRGAAVCVLMGNVPEWPVCDLGIIAAGGVSCGLYPTSSAEQCRYIIEHSDAEFVVVDTAAQLEKVLSVRDGLTKVKRFVSLDAEAARGREGVVSFAEFLRLGEERREETAASLRERAEGARADDTAVMVYTSGTTGLPKGACLSHRYVVNSVESLRGVVPVYDTDVAFSYLPFCHVAERISGLYNRLYAGAPAYFVDDLTRLGEYMLEVKPTVFASLPRFFEKIHARIVAEGATNVKEYFGGRVRLLTSGGAPLPLEVAEFFAAAGLPILQAYGLTE